MSTDESRSSAPPKIFHFSSAQRGATSAITQYMDAQRRLDDLRYHWVTLRDFAPNNRHTRAARQRVKAEAARLKQLIASIETPPPHRT